jgi:surfactin synthase thioesterase subunit
VQHLGEDQPFFGLQPPGVDGHGEPLASVEELAAYFAAQIRAFRPNSPCIIAGYCGGGTIAFELADNSCTMARTSAFSLCLAVRIRPRTDSCRDYGILAQQVRRVSKHALAIASGVMGGAPPVYHRETTPAQGAA